MSDSMQVAAQTIDSFFNGDARGKVTDRNIGFVLLAFPVGGDRTLVNYVSNCERADMIAALKEVLARWEGQPEIRGNA